MVIADPPFARSRARDIPTVAVVVPAHDEERTVGHVVRAALEAAGPGACAIVIDDGSSDATAEVAEAAGATVVRHGRRRGLGDVFRTGLDAARRTGAPVVLWIDGDGQFDAADVPRLLGPILEGRADAVTGTRFGDRGANPEVRGLHRIGNRLFTALTSRIAGERFTDTQCGFRAYSREAALRVTVLGRYTYTQEALLDLVSKGLRVAEVPVRVRSRPHGPSRLVRSVWTYGRQALPLVLLTARDHRPLRFFGSIAAALAAGALATLGFVLQHWARTGFTSPYRSLVTVGATLAVMALVVLVLALVADMQDRQRRLSEEILYRLRKLESDREVG